MTLAMSAKRTKARWVVYERRQGEFVFLSRLFPTRAQAEKERRKLQAEEGREKLKRDQLSIGVGVVGEE